MGTTTIYKKMNDLGLPFASMTKKVLKELDKLSPYKKDSYYRGGILHSSCTTEMFMLLFSGKGD